MINPFANYGKPIEPEFFEGRKPIIRFVMDRIRQGSPVSIVGERRIGKTSLLKYIKSPRALRENGLNSADYVFVYVDLLEVINPSPARFWQLLLLELSKIAREYPWAVHLSQLMTDLEKLEDDDIIGRLVRTFFDRANSYGQRIVFLLDEFENITSSESLRVTFFNSLRAHACDRITLIVATRKELKESRQEIVGSPFFNVFGSRTLGGFTETEFNTWIEHRLQDTGISFPKDAIDFILEVAGRHPFFSEMAACRMFYLFQDNEELTKNSKKELLVELGEDARQHFEYYWDNSEDAEKVALTILALYGNHRKSIKKGEGIPLESLSRRGLALRDDESYTIFSTLFAAYVKDEVYSQSMSTNATSYDEFVANYAASKPTEVIKRFASNSQQLFLKIKPAYWAIFFRVMINHGSWENLIGDLLQEWSAK